MTAPLLPKILQPAGLFAVDISTMPPGLPKVTPLAKEGLANQESATLGNAASKPGVRPPHQVARKTHTFCIR